MECNHAERYSNPHWHYALAIQSYIIHHSPLNLPWGAKSTPTHKHAHTYTLHTFECSPNTHLHATFPCDLKALFLFFSSYTPLAEQIIQRGGPVNNTTPPRPQKIYTCQLLCHMDEPRRPSLLLSSPSSPLPSPMVPLVARDAAV